VPVRFQVVPAIPLLPSLKPDLAALRALLPAEDASGVLARVRTWLRSAGPRHGAPGTRPPLQGDDAGP
jgi:hypothetical protein